MEISPIHFPAEIIKVQTTQDMAIRVTFDLPEALTDIAMWLMEVKRRGATLEMAAIPIEQVVKQEANSDIPEGAIRKSEWKTEERPRLNSDP
jgi:hypothetical protein